MSKTHLDQGREGTQLWEDVETKVLGVGHGGGDQGPQVAALGQTCRHWLPPYQHDSATGIWVGV